MTKPKTVEAIIAVAMADTADLIVRNPGYKKSDVIRGEATRALEDLIQERERLARIDELANFIEFYKNGTDDEQGVCKEMRGRIQELNQPIDNDTK